MSLFRNRKEELFERIEELQIRVIELQDENAALQEQIDAKIEVIQSLWAKEKQLEKRIERMLFELRISDDMIFRKAKEDEALNIMTEGRR